MEALQEDKRMLELDPFARPGRTLRADSVTAVEMLKGLSSDPRRA